jgi:hypothetical protein
MPLYTGGGIPKNLSRWRTGPGPEWAGQRDPTVTPDDRFELHLGQGSGWTGLEDMVRVSGNGEVVHEVRMGQTRVTGTWSRQAYRIPPEEVKALVDLLNRYKMLGMSKAYHAAVQDGTQWILLIRTAGKQKSIYCNNFFPGPVTHVAGYTHGHIVGKLGRDGEKIGVPPDEPSRHEQELWDSIN